MPVDTPLHAVAAVVYLGVFGSVIGFALYYYVIKHSEAARVALVTLVTPVLALLLGSAVDGEIVPARVWLGTALICLGLCPCINGRWWPMDACGSGDEGAGRT